MGAPWVWIVSYYQSCPLPKPEPRRKTKARRKRERRNHVAEVRQYVFARERDTCRACRRRTATDMHEIIFRSKGGNISRTNSIAVCQGCHQFLHRHDISVLWYRGMAEDTLGFQPGTKQAAEWMRVKVTETLDSPVMADIEQEC
jgi:hypothetical protein